jgi:hypothetical protein
LFAVFLAPRDYQGVFIRREWRGCGGRIRTDFPDVQDMVFASLTNCLVFQEIPDNGSKKQ